MINIRIEPVGKEAAFRETITILDALRRIDISVFSSCSGNKTCGECRVKITGIVPGIDDIDKIFITPKDLEKGWRLACLHNIEDKMIIEIPDLPKKGKILVSDLKKTEKPDINIDKYFIRSEVLKQETGSSYLNIINKLSLADSKIYVSKDKFAQIEKNMDNDFTICIHGKRIIHVEKGDKSDRKYGLAVDIGTTTVVGMLVDLNTGKTIAVEWGMNAQSKYGADIMSRIDYSSKTKKGLKILQNSIAVTLNNIIKGLRIKTGINTTNIYSAAIACNTVMAHIFAGISPSSMGYFPFRPVFLDDITIKGKDTGLNVNPEAEISLIPGIGGFVGGDITAIIFITGLHKKNEVSLALDLGTNGEMVLGSKNSITGGSTAMGPAFEGAQISCGMPAFEGALCKFSIENNKIQYKVLGNKESSGICGSGLVDIIAEFLNNGIIDSTGRLNHTENSKFKNNIFEINGQKAFLIYKNKSKQVFVSQRDIREFQLAKGAVRAGIEILLKQNQTEIENIDKIYIAGAFGNYLSKKSLIKIKIFPDFPLEKLHFVGNTASMGAKAALLSKNVKKEMRSIAQNTRHISFAGDPEFQDIFTESMLF
ncbi:ASKHA domain-containing protein [candidate division KSB1 bacterium]